MKTIEERKQELKEIIDNANLELARLSIKNNKNILMMIINNYLDVDITKKTRIEDYALGRQIYCTIRREESAGFKKIGIELGGIDHSSVIYAIQRLETRMFREKKVKELYEKIYKLYTEI